MKNEDGAAQAEPAGAPEVRTGYNTGKVDLLAALKRIAFEPFGHSEASYSEVLEDITAFARDVVARAEAK